MFRNIAVGLLLQRSSAGDELGSIDNSDQTDVTLALNSKIEAKTGKVYAGGKGVVIRNLNDGMTANAPPVVPGTLVVNDIITASTAYPNGNPFCPNDGWTGYNSVGKCSDDPYVKAVVVVVVGDQMSKLFPNFDQIQDDNWNYGVFYATDGNSVDQRCRWVEQYNGYDCPGGWIPWNGQFSADASKKGAGNYPSGNPNAGKGGGGAGCHFNQYNKGIDQFDADSQPNLVGNQWCECNYNLKGNYWNDWVNQWIYHGKAKSGYSWMGWFAGGSKKAPSFALDIGMCWVNNPRDMIMLQNAVWNSKDKWSNQLVPRAAWQSGNPSTQRYYWGWNEIPVDNAINTASTWDTIVIKLPAALCGGNGGDDNANCLSSANQHDLADQLAWHDRNGYLKPGLENIKNRPGSYIVFLREWSPQADKWQRYFFCANWKDPNGVYEVVHVPMSLGKTGACYVERHGPIPKPTPAPTPPPPPPVPACQGNLGKIRPHYATNLCLDVPNGDVKNGAHLQLWDCNGQQQQEWKWCSDGRIVSGKNDKMCIDIPGGDVHSNTYLQMWECNTHEGQYWQYDNNDMAIYPHSAGETMCMDVDGGKREKGRAVVLYKCSGGNGEPWFLGDGPAPAPPPPRRRRSPPRRRRAPPPAPVGPCHGSMGKFKTQASQSYCLDGGKVTDGAEVVIWGCNGQKQQEWIWCDDGRIVSGQNDKMCIDIDENSKRLQMWDCNGHSNQYWSYDSKSMAVSPASTGETMCMDLEHGKYEQGARVIVYACKPGTGEAWLLGGGKVPQSSNMSIEFV